MTKKTSSASSTRALADAEPDWTTPSRRVAWVLKNLFGDNKSAFAKKIGLSHTIIGKVCGGQAPGRKMLTAIAECLGVNSAWLLTGRGQPYTRPPTMGGRPRIPESRQLLPGAPLDYLNLTTGVWFDAADTLFSSTQYWLALSSSEPILRDPRRGFLVNDRLLFETDRTRFPAKHDLMNQLCIVRFRGGDPPLRLGSLTHFPACIDDPEERLEIDTFDHTLDSSQQVREEVYRHYPDGRIRHLERRMRTIDFRGDERLVEVDEAEPPDVPTVLYSDIVGVWLAIIRRNEGVY